MKGKQIKKIIYFSILAWIIILCILAIPYLQEYISYSEPEKIEEISTPLAQRIYDSEDIAIIIQKNTEERQIQFQNIQTGKRYTLTYDGATSFTDKYEQQLAITQAYPGMIATIQFYKDNKKLISLAENTDCFHLDHISNYKIDFKKSEIQYKDKCYKINNHIILISKEQEIDFMDLNAIDEISILGFADHIYSIIVEKGHSYLRLQNETYFVDGWIEIGQNIIKKVTEDMIIVVPEGENTVYISHKGNNATQKINFPANEEIAWDLGNVEINLPKTGTIIFTITPNNAIVTIDGEQKDHSQPINLSYGVHQITISAKDYESLSKYIKVGSPSANISVDLEEKEKEKYPEKNKEKAEDINETANNQETKTDTQTKPETEANKESQEKTETKEQANNSDSITTASTAYKVHIDSPEGVEVYLDGNYIGIAPISFPKKTGNYIITLRKDGYQTRSYSLQVDDEEKDVNYSFSELSSKQ